MPLTIVAQPAGQLFQIVDAPDNPSKQDLESGSRAFSGSIAASTAVSFARRLATPDLRRLMGTELRLAAGQMGETVFRVFIVNVISPPGFLATFDVNHDISKAVKASNGFQQEHNLFKAGVDKNFQLQALSGVVDYRKLTGGVGAPQVGYNQSELAMLALFGTFQGHKVFLKDFVGDDATRSYTATLRYELRDHFGMDDSDCEPPPPHGTPGQIAFWVLQHDRHTPGHMPYIDQVNLEIDISGSF